MQNQIIFHSEKNKETKTPRLLLKVRKKCCYISQYLSYSNATLFVDSTSKRCVKLLQPGVFSHGGPCKLNYTKLCYSPDPSTFILFKSYKSERLTIENASPQLLYKQRNYLNQISSHIFKKVSKLSAFLLNYRKLLLLDNFL